MANLAQGEKVTKRRLTQSRVLLVTGAVLILLGVAPGICMIWYGSQGFPLSVPITLARGQYTSPWFTPKVSDMWDIDLKWSYVLHPIDPLSIHWKIIDERGSYIAQGTFDSQIAGNMTLLGLYKSKRGVRQCILLDVHDGVPEEKDAHPMLKIEDPRLPEDMSFAFPIALIWAAIFGGCGLIVLIVGKISRAPRSE